MKNTKINKFILSKKGDRVTNVPNLFFSRTAKKGDIAINQMFIIFVSVIAVFVIVGMLAKWSLNSSDFMCKLSGECGGEGKVDKESIEVDNPTKFLNEVVKQSKLCFERGRKGQISGELCYTVKCTSGCKINCNTIKSPVEKTVGADNLECNEFGEGSKAIISYDYKTSHVIIR
ncbi:hypothetical protein HOD20_00365 [archaeon]|jgi:hypothetical protein|nr:hypothetical protein [archaeon]MBT4350955.1 hypothetical protein [archaeon]MBT4646896.1 hypothetical protein [archaeon]MBT6822141.1 hypothetical protein [archaeon]MBT7392984.1 hypothetical protein [archaeon]